jgi:hypothetical protein
VKKGSSKIIFFSCIYQVTSNDHVNQAMLRSEGLTKRGEGQMLFKEAEMNAQLKRGSGGGVGSSVGAAISNITQSTIAECSSPLCMLAYIDFWRETDSRGLLPWNLPDCVFVTGGSPAAQSRVPIGISGAVRPKLICTLASYLQDKSPPSQGAALLLLHRVMLMLKALHSSSLVAVSLCSSSIVCTRPQHPDEYYKGAMASDMFADVKQKQRCVGDWCEFRDA